MRKGTWLAKSSFHLVFPESLLHDKVFVDLIADYRLYLHMILILEVHRDDLKPIGHFVVLTGDIFSTSYDGWLDFYKLNLLGEHETFIIVYNRVKSFLFRFEYIKSIELKNFLFSTFRSKLNIWMKYCKL
jgi:hypothetical protein